MPISKARRWAYSYAALFSAHATQRIGRRFGAELDMWLGCGYPKSGTMWLCRLLASYTGAPLVQGSALPIVMRAVTHSHELPSESARREAYIYRDGRDVLLSMYHHQALMLKQDVDPRATRKIKNRHRRIFGSSYDLDDIEGNLPKFLAYEMERPFSARVPWHEHVSRWLDEARPRRAYVKYESLLKDPEQTARRLLLDLGVEEVNSDIVRLAVQRNSFHALRNLTLDGEGNDFVRAGVAGGWAEIYSKEAREVFDHYAGSTLERLGYETSRNWVSDEGA